MFTVIARAFDASHSQLAEAEIRTSMSLTDAAGLVIEALHRKHVRESDTPVEWETIEITVQRKD